ncbi:MAG TPA: hypothetical protein V6D08_18645 [Candidatus Obscuribacterales bacterium]
MTEGKTARISFTLSVHSPGARAYSEATAARSCRPPSVLSRGGAAGRRDGALRIIFCAWLLVLAFSLTLPLVASAQFAEPLVPPGDQLPIPPGQPLPEPFAPPPGDGANPLPVIPGDNGAPLPPPSGTADRTHGNIFPAGNGRDRTVVRIYTRSNGGALGTDRGLRMVQTIRPDQLSSEQINRIQSILGINMLSGEQSVDVVASDGQIEQIQDVLAKYPQYQMENGRKKITRDAVQKPGIGWKSAREKENLYNFDGPLPTVRTFARYLVLLGVVSATIWMALAATSVILGHRDGGAKVISSVAGLMLLLMGYTIWKVVQMNTFNRNSDTPAASQNRPNEAQVSDAYIQGSSVPPAPNGGRAQPERFGVPLEPLGGPH